jgi:nucleotide-binding universal stress UspA family protein
MSHPHTSETGLAAPPDLIHGPVVVAVDNHAAGHGVLPTAELLARLTGGSLRLAAFYPSRYRGLPSFPAEAESVARRAAETLGPDAPPHEIAALHATSPTRGLHDLAVDVRAAAIVVGRHGRPNPVFPHEFVSAERLLQGGSVPVVVVPEGWEPSADGFARIGAGVDDSPESEAALAAAITLAGRSGGEVEAFGVFDPPNPANPLFAVTTHGYHEILGDLRGAAEHRLESAAQGTPAHVRLLEGDPAEELVRVTQGLDLLVIGSRRYGALQAVLAGGTGAAVVDRATCPVLVVPRPEPAR